MSSRFTEVDVVGDEDSPAPVTQENADVSKVNGRIETKSGSRTPIGEEWELDCEVCHRRGINLVRVVSMFCPKYLNRVWLG